MSKLENVKTELFNILDEAESIKNLVTFHALSNETIMRGMSDNGYVMTKHELSGLYVVNEMINTKLEAFNNKLTELYQSLKAE
jgi:hypothetical protein